MPRVSIIIPIHPMQDKEYFLWRLIDSITKQTFIDYEIIVTQEGRMAENTNAAIKRARGELIKILYLDDFFAHKNALKEIVENFKKEDNWLVTGCLHQEIGGYPHIPHLPTWNENVKKGNNTLGSPSVVTIRNHGHLLFDERLDWMLDCDFYDRYYKAYGLPKMIDDSNVVIGIGEHQSTYLISMEQKQSEVEYLRTK